MEEQIQLTDFINEINSVYNTDIDKESLIRFIWDLDDSISAPYKFLETRVEQGDGESPEVSMILERQSDNKLFSLWTYQGEIQEDILRETSQKKYLKNKQTDCFDDIS